jgi:hypothetical protein
VFLTRFAAPGDLTEMSNQALSSTKGTIVHLKQINNTSRAVVVLAE